MDMTTAISTIRILRYAIMTRQGADKYRHAYSHLADAQEDIAEASQNADMLLDKAIAIANAILEEFHEQITPAIIEIDRTGQARIVIQARSPCDGCTIDGRDLLVDCACHSTGRPASSCPACGEG